MRPSSSSFPSFTVSSVTVAIDKATNELLFTPDWTIIIAICDSVNSNHWQCKDAIKAVKRRLQHKNSKVQLLTLTLLEAMMKNCGEFMHSHIADKHVLEEMVKIVKKKGDFEVRNKILILLDTWNEALTGAACKHPHYNWAYRELTRYGVEFPPHSKEAPLMLIGSFRRLDETMATKIEGLSLSSLESMRNVMDLVNDMVQAINPTDKSALKDELIVDLVEQCRSNQKKLIHMLTTIADEDVMAHGLEMNDSLQVVLARHDAIASGVSLPMLQQAPKTRETDDDVALESDDSSSSSSSSFSSESEKNEGKEVKNDDFMQLTKRHTLLNVEHNNEEEEETLLLGNKNEKRIKSEAKKQCKDIALFDTTTTTTRSKSEQNIIELLSLTLSTTTLPTPQTLTQPPSNTSLLGDDHILMNSYVVPWAQSQADPQVEKMAQFSPSEPQFSYGYPQPQWSGGQINCENTSLWIQGSNKNNEVFERNLQYSNPFPTGVAGPSSVAAVVDGQPHKPYIPPYRLFEDLNVFRNAEEGVRSSK